jgi:decaprenylphospho-beta-D-ribofuranose 2-oxidase
VTWVNSSASGWGRFPLVSARIAEPINHEAVLRAWMEPSRIISRGLGRSYGDPAVPDIPGGALLSNRGRTRMLEFDEATGELTAESGLSLAEIIDAFQPRGWFLPTTPGTKFVTLGGAIAADVHGKNHHVDGSFGAHVQRLTLLTGRGDVIACSPVDHADVFWATVGGMGLTGHILDLTVRLRRVPSAWYRVTYQKAQDLDTALQLLRERDGDFRYSVAWIDCLARGKNLGRSVLMLGNDAAPDELDRSYRGRPYEIPTKRAKSVPCDFPAWALNSWSVSAFNQVFYWKNANCTKIVDYDTFFYPLDGVHQWNRIYGSRGFVQYQALFPEATAAEGLREVLEAITEARLASFLAVLKRSGPAGSGWLSYLFPGYTLALDIPNVGEPLRTLVRLLDHILLNRGGRLYLAKDTLATPEVIQTMYPRLGDFQTLKRRLDPEGRIASGLSARLGITS